MPNNELDKAKRFILFQPNVKGKSPSATFHKHNWPFEPVARETGNCFRDAILSLYCWAITLSSAKAFLCCREARKRKKWKRAGDDEKRKERKRGLFPLPIVHHAVTIFLIIAIFIGIPSGSLCGRAWERLSRIHQNFPGAIRPCSNPVSRETLK